LLRLRKQGLLTSHDRCNQGSDCSAAPLNAVGSQTIASPPNWVMADELRTILDFLRKGDVLMVTHIDGLARSIGDLQDIVLRRRARH
jgi:hypothetical protein